MLSACSRFIGVGRLLAIYRSSAFLLFYRHEFHPAFRTISRMIGYDFGMHRAGVFLHLLLLLACRAGGRRAGRRRVLVSMRSAVRSPCESPTAQVRSRLWLKCVFAFRLVVGQAPRLPAGKTATGAVALQTERDCDCSTRGKAEREREGSAARSIQRTKMRRVVRCRVTAAQQFATNTQRTRPPERENSHRRISRHSRAQSFVFAKTTARRILQHCTCEDCSFCFAGLEWNGHSVCALSISVATAANAQ